MIVNTIELLIIKNYLTQTPPPPPPHNNLDEQIRDKVYREYIITTR